MLNQPASTFLPTPPRLLAARRCYFIATLAVFLMCWAKDSEGQIPDTFKLKTEQWAASGMTQDPVSLSFDNRGKLYLTETARRSNVDIDLRSHKEWLLDDLASDSFDTMRGFFRRRMATSLSAENQNWLKDHNQDGVHDYRDLTTISERIRTLEDTDGDGVADKSTLFADGFQEEFTGVAAGVMPYKDAVFVTVYPDLWLLRDTDGDGTADERTILFRGFGVHAALDGHDLHGLTVGPEGKIYFSCGDNGFSVVTQEGTRLHYPNTGGVLRMNPDGSELEVFAYGLRNVQEFDFDAFGNMFGVDNDGDLGDERERAVYIAEGSDSGWRTNWQFRAKGWTVHNGGMTYNPWTAEGMWTPQHSQQPAHITPPMQNYSVGPGGFVFNPGTALNDEYRDFFFCVQFPVQKVTAFRTQPRGAGFEMADEHVFHSGLMISSVKFGPDGGCYLADWVGKWEPNGEGAVYRVDDPEQRNTPRRKEVQSLLRDGVGRLENAALTKLLAHPDRRIRQLAQFELVNRKLGSKLLTIARSQSAHQLARIHALWGLLQLEDTALLEDSTALPWTDTDYQIRQLCCRIAGDMHLSAAEPYLVRLLEDPQPLVRSHAAIALGKVGTEQSTDALLELLRRNADVDAFERHAAVMGLAGAASSEQLVARAHDPSPAVRIGAVLALGRKNSDAIRVFLDDEDVRVQREAVRAVHDDLSIASVLPDLASKLNQATVAVDEPTLRRLISACFRSGNAEALTEFVANPERSGPLFDTLKVEALECLARWDAPISVDRVVGMIRPHDSRPPGLGKQALVDSIDSILTTASPAVWAAALGLVNDMKIRVDPEQFRSWVTSSDIDIMARRESLRSLHQNQDPQTDAIIDDLIAGQGVTEGDSLWQFAFELLVERRPEVAMKQIQWDVAPPLRQFFVSQLPRFETPQADKQLRDLVRRQLQADSDVALTLDVLAAAENRADQVPELAQLKDFLANKPDGAYHFAKQGGDVRRGEQLYMTHVSAQCTRCHNAGAQGKQAGPVLDNIAEKGAPYLWEALVHPSAVIAKGYESISVLLDDGEVVTGTVITEDQEELILGTAQKTHTIRKAQIEQRLDAKLSAMPKITEVLSPLEIRDIVAYLLTLSKD